EAMPAPPRPDLMPDPPPPSRASAASITAGKSRYQSLCSVCHGDSAVSGGVLPDLRYTAALANPGQWQRIVRDGVLESGGMVSFASQLTAREIETIRDYVIYRANQTRRERAAHPY
ncbi:MAG TPA: cytochrome c, partial [Steroidobacteraceae bacterium]|nr:cytochrome c [Steroidobacteraceae bacterium]